MGIDQKWSPHVVSLISLSDLMLTQTAQGKKIQDLSKPTLVLVSFFVFIFDQEWKSFLYFNFRFDKVGITKLFERESYQFATLSWNNMFS